MMSEQQLPTSKNTQHVQAVRRSTGFVPCSRTPLWTCKILAPIPTRQDSHNATFSHRLSFTQHAVILDTLCFRISPIFKDVQGDSDYSLFLFQRDDWVWFFWFWLNWEVIGVVTYSTPRKYQNKNCHFNPSVFTSYPWRTDRLTSRKRWWWCKQTGSFPLVNRLEFKINLYCCINNLLKGGYECLPETLH